MSGGNENGCFKWFKTGKKYFIILRSFVKFHMVPIIQNRSVIIWYSLQKNVTWSAVRMTATML